MARRKARPSITPRKHYACPFCGQRVVPNESGEWIDLHTVDFEQWCPACNRRWYDRFTMKLWFRKGEHTPEEGG